MLGRRMSGRSLILSATFAAIASTAHAGTVIYDLGGTGSTNIEGHQSAIFWDSSSGERVRRVQQFGDAWSQTQNDADGALNVRVTAGAFTAGTPGDPDDYSPETGVTESGLFLGGAVTLDSDPHVTQKIDGLGVMNNGLAFTDDAREHVDGSSGGIFGDGWFDFLVVDLDREAAFDYVQFSQWGPEDTFRLIYDADGDGVIGSAGDFLTDEKQADASGFFDGFLGFNSDIVGIAAVGENAAWRLEEIGLTFGQPIIDPPTDDEPPYDEPPVNDPPLPAPVPLPAAGWLLVASIAGLAAMRRRVRS